MTALEHPAYRAGKRLWSAREDSLLRERYPNDPTGALAADLGRTLLAVYGRARHLGLVKSQAFLDSSAACRLRREATPASIATRFKPGQVPLNKGLRRPGWSAGRMRETQFRPGERKGIAVHVYKPIGTERISKDGYRQRKVNDDLPLQRRWRAVHLILWEEAHGPVPPGYAVAFQNGDKTDIRLDNLALIARRDLMARNSVHTLPPALKQTVQLLGQLNRQIRRRTTTHAQQD